MTAATTTSTLKKITLNLARTKAFPEGSAAHGYEIVAPLDETGRLDPLGWRAHRKDCKVRRFWAGESGEFGWLVHRPGGAGGATWVFDYMLDSEEDDETGYRLGSHIFAVGEYVSVRDDDGELHTFKVVAIKDV